MRDRAPVERSEQVARIAAFVRRHPRALVFDEAAETLLDVFSGKTVPLDLARLVEARYEANRETGGTYLVLRRDDGLELALAEPGIAFAPDPVNTGPLPNPAAAVCLRDFHQAVRRLRHHLFDHPDAPVSQDTLAQVQFAIAVLDGARRIGMDVGAEERELDRLLSEVERRGKP